MKRLYFSLLIMLLCINLHSHPWKPSHYVIVDTDGGIDDIRAITILLGSPDVRVLAITVSPGALSAEHAYIKVKSLLNSFYHEGIPVGINRGSAPKLPEFSVALETIWGNETDINPGIAPDVIPLISGIISSEKSKISFMCLGSMSTAFQALRNIPGFGKQVKDFIWSSDGYKDKHGFNYNIDKNSSTAMLKQEIPVKVVRNFTFGDTDFYTTEFIGSVDSLRTVYARKISDFFLSSNSKNHKFAYSANDEMAVLFLHYPGLFINNTTGNITDCTPSDPDDLRKYFIRILKGETAQKNQVMKEFPGDPSFYFDDLAGSVSSIIMKYGMDEWSSGVLANEMHRHLGVFAIIGVKMGIRAREYFDTGVDEFRVKSYAGSVPPLSCFNDGLQVSTGATPGHGLLTVINEPPISPSAEFTYMNMKIRFTLKTEITKKIISELKEIDFVYGLDSNTYWELVRKNSIKYWLSMDRHEIFEIEVIN
jgi:pyrimidine-specific ribonucleoside hydrolase